MDANALEPADAKADANAVAKRSNFLEAF